MPEASGNRGKAGQCASFRVVPISFLIRCATPPQAQCWLPVAPGGSPPMLPPATSARPARTSIDRARKQKSQECSLDPKVERELFPATRVGVNDRHMAQVAAEGMDLRRIIRAVHQVVERGHP